MSKINYTLTGTKYYYRKIYGKTGETAYVKVVLVTDCGTICELSKKERKNVR